MTIIAICNRAQKLTFNWNYITSFK